MWNTFFIQPVVNLLVLIQSFMPGNDLGLAIFAFTLLVRVLMWPLIKKQIHQTRMMQKLNPEIQKIRSQAKGKKDRETLEGVNKETMLLYKKHGVNPFASFGVMLVQLPLFIAIYSAVRTAFSKDTSGMGNLLYDSVKGLSYVKDGILGSGGIVTTFANWADLAKKPFVNNEIYLPVLIIALVSIFVQYLQVKQTLPPKNKEGNSDDPAERMNRITPYIMVLLFGWISLSVEGAISFYLGASALIAVFQQYFLMRKEDSMLAKEASAKPKVAIVGSKSEKNKAKEATVVKSTVKGSVKPKPKNSQSKKGKTAKAKNSKNKSKKK